MSLTSNTYLPEVFLRWSPNGTPLGLEKSVWGRISPHRMGIGDAVNLCLSLSKIYPTSLFRVTDMETISYVLTDLPCLSDSQGNTTFPSLYFWNNQIQPTTPKKLSILYSAQEIRDWFRPFTQQDPSILLKVTKGLPLFKDIGYIFPDSLASMIPMSFFGVSQLFSSGDPYNYLGVNDRNTYRVIKPKIGDSPQEIIYVRGGKKVESVE